jgi:hypothetical protein
MVQILFFLVLHQAVVAMVDKMADWLTQVAQVVVHQVMQVLVLARLHLL